MLGDKFIDVEADSKEAAQEMAFVKLVRDLSPADFKICGEEWGATADREGEHGEG